MRQPPPTYNHSHPWRRHDGREHPGPVLEGEGYATSVLKTFPMGEAQVEEEEMPVGGVDLMVLASSLSTSECGHDDPMLVCNRGNSKAVFYVAFIIPTSTTEEGLRIDDPQPKECNDVR